MIRFLCLVAYYGFARYLPYSGPRWARWARSVRRVVCTPLFKRAGRDLNIERGARFGFGRELEIGDRSGLGLNAQVMGPVRIGADVMMGPEVLILTGRHRFDRIDVPMREQGAQPPLAVTIGDDVWIGARVILLPGVTVGRGSILGAGSVITRDVPPRAIVGGNPARVLRMRDGEEGEMCEGGKVEKS